MVLFRVTSGAKVARYVVISKFHLRYIKMKFSKEDQEFYDLQDLAALPTSKDEITRSLLWWWLSYFRLNEDYEEYCTARRNGDAVACNRLEKEFPNIAELFNDWGDIHVLPIVADETSPEWKAWLDAHHHLFFAKSLAINLVGDSQRKCDPSHVLVSIPTGLSHKQLRKLFEQFLNYSYPDSPEFAGANAQPKYNLNCQIGVRKLKSIQKTFLVGTLIEEEDYSPERVAEMVFENPPLYVAGHFEWEPSHHQDISSGQQEKYDPDHNKRSIYRMHDDHRRYIAGTIKGIFPIDPE